MRAVFRSLRLLVFSFSRAFAGVGFLLREPNARIHLAAASAVTGAGYLVGLSPLEWALVFTNFGLVFALEAINTALESYVDLAAPGWHAMAGRAKDAAAGAVLVASMATVVVAVFLFGPRWAELLAAFRVAWAAARFRVAAYLAVTLVFLLGGILWRGKWPR